MKYNKFILLDVSINNIKKKNIKDVYEKKYIKEIIDEEYIKQEIEKRIKNILPIDNDAFAYFAQDKMFCQELLRVLLEDDELIVLENEPQKFLPNIYFKSAIIDLLCKLKDGRIVNVEIQLYKDPEHAKRIMQYVTMIRQAFVEKGEEYSKINDIIIIYLTEEDIFNKGNTIYDVDMRIMSDTKEYIEKWDCGVQVKYINTKGITNKKINEYLQLLVKRNTESEKYPEVTKIKKDIYEIGGRGMSTWMQEMMEKCETMGEARGEARGRKEGEARGRQEGEARGRKEGITNLLESLFRDGVITKEEMEKRLSMV